MFETFCRASCFDQFLACSGIRWHSCVTIHHQSPSITIHHHPSPSITTSHVVSFAQIPSPSPCSLASMDGWAWKPTKQKHRINQLWSWHVMTHWPIHYQSIAAIGPSISKCCRMLQDVAGIRKKCLAFGLKNQLQTDRSAHSRPRDSYAGCAACSATCRSCRTFSRSFSHGSCAWFPNIKDLQTGIVQKMLYPFLIVLFTPVS